MTHPSEKKILLSPLDWGLGHTTRCIPLARHLLGMGARVFFAGTETQIAFFRKSFPEISFLPLRGYKVRYSQTRRGFMPHLLRQLPGIFKTIRHEHEWLLREAAKHRFDGILSDNRYGLWHPEIPSVFLTHQPGLKTGFGAGADALFARLHQGLMQNFREIWLVDIPEKPGLSGALAHPSLLPPNARYIGLLSQFTDSKWALHSVAPLPPEAEAGGEASGNPFSSPQNALVILLSGPEPQRSILSQKLWEQIAGFPEMPVVFIEGRADAPQRTAISGNIRWQAQADAATLRPLLQGVQYVISRSGYSTLMDAAVLGLRLILIPTPGQTEQEYLGQMLLRDQKALCFRQEDFCLKNALEAAEKFPFLPLGFPENARQFVPVLEAWYGRL